MLRSVIDRVRPVSRANPLGDGPGGVAGSLSVVIAADLLVEVEGALPDGLAPAPRRGNTWESLLPLLDTDAANQLHSRIVALLSRGEAFDIFVGGADGTPLRAEGAPLGLRASISLVTLTEAEARLLRERNVAVSRAARAEALLAGLANAPVALIATQPDGTISWQTKVAAKLAHEVLDPAELTRPADDIRAIAACDPQGVPRHLKVSATSLDGSDTLYTILDQSALVTARSGLRSFMATMTETFANLGTGLAVFDRGRGLALFNPALADLFGLDHAALAARPTLRDFLDALRRARRLPEQSDFTRWRDRFIAEATGQASGEMLSQDWPLPDGDILRVTGQVHMGGSLVLLFEDISDHVSRERRYRVEMEASQSILDRLGEGVAVFASSGRAVYANDAFTHWLGFDPFRSLMDGNGLHALIDHASGRFGQPQDWQDFLAYAVSDQRSRDWARAVALDNGDTLWLRASPLPDGSTMLVVVPENTGLPEAAEPPLGHAPPPRAVGAGH